MDRVAVVLTELRAGGMERVVVHLAGGLAGRGIAVQVICVGAAGVLAEELTQAGVPVTALGSRRGYDVGAVCRLAGVLRRFRPSVVNVHDYSSLPYVLLARRMGARSPVVFTAHGLLYEGFEGRRKRYRRAARRLGAMTAVSEQVAGRHREYLGWDGPIAVVPNGVPGVVRSDEQREGVRRELGIGRGVCVFLAVGNARPEKGFEDLVEAAAMLRQSAGEAGFAVLIAGKVDDSAYCEGLRARLAELNLDGTVRLLGFRRDTGALYSAADVFVMSSRSEGLPMVLLEAMTAGLPVVTTAVGGIPAAVTDECALSVRPKSPEDLAAAMRTVLCDSDRRERMGAAAERIASERYTVDGMVDRYVGVFEAVGRGQRARVRLFRLLSLG